jgi:hypothetical protein
LCWKSHWDAFCPQFHAIGIRPGWPVHEDSVVLAISAEKDGELRVVYARIGRCQGHPAWRVLKLRWRVLPPDDAAKFMQRFGGEKFDPKQSGRGSSWARWKK